MKMSKSQAGREECAAIFYLLLFLKDIAVAKVRNALVDLTSFTRLGEGVSKSISPSFSYFHLHLNLMSIKAHFFLIPKKVWR